MAASLTARGADDGHDPPPGSEDEANVKTFLNMLMVLVRCCPYGTWDLKAFETKHDVKLLRLVAACFLVNDEYYKVGGVGHRSKGAAITSMNMQQQMRGQSHVPVGLGSSLLETFSSLLNCGCDPNGGALQITTRKKEHDLMRQLCYSQRISKQTLGDSLLLACANLDEEGIILLLNAKADVHHQLRGVDSPGGHNDFVSGSMSLALMPPLAMSEMPGVPGGSPGVYNEGAASPDADADEAIGFHD